MFFSFSLGMVEQTSKAFLGCVGQHLELLDGNHKREFGIVPHE
jgi:hypothetical protein